MHRFSLQLAKFISYKNYTRIHFTFYEQQLVSAIQFIDFF